MSLIFLLEDDAALGSNLKCYLETQGYAVQWARDLVSARAVLPSKSPDLFLLDWTLPDGTGLDFLRGLRQAKRIPVFFLTAREDEDSAVRALEAGATDYLRKPFGHSELSIKIKKALNEAVNPSKKIRLASLVLDQSARVAMYGEKELILRRKEFDVLEILLKKGGEVTRREDLLQILDEETTDRTVDSYVSRIRKALQKVHASDLELVTIYGEGYRLRKAA